MPRPTCLTALLLFPSFFSLSGCAVDAVTSAEFEEERDSLEARMAALEARLGAAGTTETNQELMDKVAALEAANTALTTEIGDLEERVLLLETFKGTAEAELLDHEARLAAIEADHVRRSDLDVYLTRLEADTTYVGSAVLVDYVTRLDADATYATLVDRDATNLRVATLEASSVLYNVQLMDHETRLDNMDLANYATESYVDTAVANASGSIPFLSNYLRVDTATHSVILEGANLYVQSGSGATDGAVNGLGNLIIGYGEDGSYYGGQPSDRSGSHNLVAGGGNSYSSFGGLLAGNLNVLTGAYTSVTGGFGNTATGEGSSVSGGYLNVASNYTSAVSGGVSNLASGPYSSVSGGMSNVASGERSTASGGYSNQATGFYSSVSGGQSNFAGDYYSSILGGYGNTASSDWSSVSGGVANVASGDYSSVSGGNANVASGIVSSAFGGYFNVASGSESVVSGGVFNLATGEFSVVSGGRGGEASGYSSVVSAGDGNRAAADYSSVSGGHGNATSGQYSAILGGSSVGLATVYGTSPQ